MTLTASEARNRVVDVCLRYLEAEGATAVFGIPGGLLHPFFETVLATPGFRLVVSKHEEGAAFMADGYARVSGRLAVCAGTAGPGATNLLTGVACAYADGVPMLVLTGQAASHALGKGAAQETGREDMDIVAMFAPITKYSAMVPSPAKLGHHLRRALRLALSGRPGPVHLNVPVDFWYQPCAEDWFDPSTYRTTTLAFDRRNVSRAAQTLLNARRPAILAGAGVRVSRAMPHLRALAELLGAKVATSPRGKGCFAEDHPLSLGVLGFAGHDEARRVLLGGGVDVLLTIGASLNETTTFNWDPNLRPTDSFIQTDVDADRIGRNYPVDIPLIGDAQTILVELVYHIHRLIRLGKAPRTSWIPEDDVPRRRTHLDEELRRSDAIPLKPQRWRVDLEEVLPDDAIVFSDIGGHMLFNIHHLTVREGQAFYVNLGFGSMGHGTVAPIGAALAVRRPIISIVGDGCLSMNGMELLTAREYDIPVVWIVENNDMHGITWHGSKTVGTRQPLDAVRFKKKLDVAGIASAFGLQSWVVDRPGQLQTVLPLALDSKSPAVIEVKVDGSVSPPLGDRAKSVAGFVREDIQE